MYALEAGRRRQQARLLETAEAARRAARAEGAKERKGHAVQHEPRTPGAWPPARDRVCDRTYAMMRMP